MAAALLPEDESVVLEDNVEALLGNPPEPQLEDGEELVDLSKEQPAPEPVAAQPAKKAPVEDELPEAYRGKSAKEIAKMHQDAQALIGRQGAELGDLRKRADQFILSALETRRAAPAAAQPAAAPAAQPAKIDDVEIFKAPVDTISKLIEQHPLILEIKRTLGDNAQQAEIRRATDSTARFNAAHPDAAQIIAEPEFQQWVQASPVRRQLLARAHHKFDFDAGDEIFSTYKALKGVGKQAAAVAAGDAAASEAARTLAARRQQAAKAAAVPSGGNAAPGQAAGKSNKVFRRADVLKLMEEDPERYEQMAPEIEAAYRENRVR